MRSFSDEELVEFADWAEMVEKDATADMDLRRVASGIRQGIDWMIRYRVRQKAQDIRKAGIPNNVTVERRQ